MAQPIPSAPNLSTANQVPANSILDQFNRQTYLGNEFSLPINVQTLAGTTETPIALVINPVTVSSVVNVKSIFHNLRVTASDNGSGDGTSFFRYYINPTVTSTGTKTVPVNCRPASSTTSIANCYLNGQFTVSSNGTLWRVLMAGYSAVNDSSLMLILDPGQSFLITTQAATAGSTVINASSWYEQ